MDDLVPVFDFAVYCIGRFLYVMNSMWFTQILLYVVLLSVVVSVIITLRGGHS